MIPSLRYAALLGLGMLYGCSKSEEHVPSPDEQRIMKLELKIEQMEQEHKSDERIFLDNVKLLRDYVSSHPMSFADEHDDSEQVVSAAYFHDTTKQGYSDFKSWSKRALDGFSEFFVGHQGGK